jgi:hypothetical protein
MNVVSNNYSNQFPSVLKGSGFLMCQQEKIRIENLKKSVMTVEGHCSWALFITID